MLKNFLLTCMVKKEYVIHKINLKQPSNHRLIFRKALKVVNSIKKLG